MRVKRRELLKVAVYSLGCGSLGFYFSGCGSKNRRILEEEEDLAARLEPTDPYVDESGVEIMPQSATAQAATVSPAFVQAIGPALGNLARAVVAKVGLKIGKHALEKMVARAISADKVADVVKNGRVFFDVQTGARVYWKDGIAVVVNTAKNKIITVYEGAIKVWRWIEQ